MRVCGECGFRSSNPDEFCPTDGSKLLDSEDDALLGHAIGRYRITRVLGTGGMGRVYQAVQPAIGSRVAVKVLSRECSERPDLIERFFAEAQAVNRIRHENIVNIIDLSALPDGRPYIIMEYLEGRALADIIAGVGWLPLGTMCDIALEILRALSAAHGSGIIHRDLKPDNIFMSPQGRVKVLDFGIAKLMPKLDATGSAGPTQTGVVLGTPGYMSPEQITGGSIAPPTDVYALGVMLYEAATGTLPFSADTLFGLMQQHVNQAPRPPRSLRTDLSPALEAVILKALAKAPEARFGSADAMARAIAEARTELSPAAWAALTLSDTVISSPAMGTPTPVVSRKAPPAVNPLAIAATAHLAGASLDLTPGAPDSAQGVDRSVALAPDEPVPTPSAARRGAGRRLGLVAVVIVLAAGIGGGIAFMAKEQSVSARPPADPPAADLDDMSTEDATLAAAAELPTPAPGSGPPPAPAPAPPPRSAPGKRRAVKPPSPRKPAPKITPAAAAPQPKPAPKTTPAAAAPQPEPAPAARGVTHVGGVTMVNRAALATEKTGIKPLKLEANVNTARFDGSAFLPRARQLARRLMPDARLVEFEVEGVYESGLANLRFGEASYWFRSASRSGRPRDVPRGVEIEIPCMVYVDVTPRGIDVYPVTREVCNDRFLRSPRCSLAQVWSRAKTRGAPASNTVAEIDYLSDGWSFSIGDEFSESFADDCR